MAQQYQEAFCAIHEDTNDFFIGAHGQVAFCRIGNLKQSMHGKYGTANWRDPKWTFYKINSLDKRMEVVNKNV